MTGQMSLSYYKQIKASKHTLAGNSFIITSFLDS